MSKLLRAGVRRYLHCFVFWLGIIATAVFGVVGGYNARHYYLEDFYIMLEFMVFAVVISWLVGREYGEGIFRNKVICGHTKGKIFLSELILGEGAAMVMFLLYAGIFAAFNGYVFGVIDTSILLRVFLDMFLVNLCYAALLVTISCLLPNRFAVMAVNILVVLGLCFAAYQIEGILAQEEFTVEYEWQYGGDTTDGKSYMTIVPGSEHQVENPNYVGGTPRDILTTVYSIIFYSRVVEYRDMSMHGGWFHYEGRNGQSDPSWEIDARGFELTEEENADLSLNLLYSLGTLAVISTAGYLGFRKKELK